jgi:hypothetical protein
MNLLIRDILARQTKQHKEITEMLLTEPTTAEKVTTISEVADLPPKEITLEYLLQEQPQSLLCPSKQEVLSLTSTMSRLYAQHQSKWNRSPKEIEDQLQKNSCENR